MVPAFGPSGFGYFPDQSPASTSQSSSQLPPSSEFDAYMPGGGSPANTRQYQRRPGAPFEHGVLESFIAA